jgi:hypothetical protein
MSKAAVILKVIMDPVEVLKLLFYYGDVKKTIATV